MNETHIDITIDLSDLGGGCIDLRIPKKMIVQTLMINVLRLTKQITDETNYYLKVLNKEKTLLMTDCLTKIPVTTGDLLKLYMYE